jgi:HEAT repeat protein
VNLGARLPFVVAILSIGGSALAQYQPHGFDRPQEAPDVRRRYDAVRNGSNIDDWSRRLEDQRPDVRLEAVKSIGEAGGERSSELLMKAVGDADPRVASKAVDYLGKNRATDATQFLTERLFLSGTAPELRHRILSALGRIGDTRASRPILDYLERDRDPDVRGTGIYALGELADPAIRPDLEKLDAGESDPRLKRLIGEAIAKISGKKGASLADERALPGLLRSPPDPTE